MGIAFLQETHLYKTDHFRLKCEWVGQLYHSNFNSKSRSTAILIEKNIPFEALMVEADSTGRYVIVVGKLYNLSVVLSNVYAPNYDDSLFFTNIFSRLPKLNTHQLILGDLNCVMSSFLDRSSLKATIPPKSADTIKLNYSSIHMGYIWDIYMGYQTYLHIDYFFLDNNLLPLVSHCEYHAIVISDHAPLTVTLCIPLTLT